MIDPTFEEALTADTEARQREQRYKHDFASLGTLMLRVETRELWKFLPQGFNSFDEWLLDAMPCARSTAYSALGVARRLSGIPEAERSLISPGNLKTLAEVSSPIAESRPILDLAKTMKPAEFRAMMIQEHPEQHLEANKPYRFLPTEGQRQDVDAALALAMSVDGAVTREEALWSLANFYRLYRPRIESMEVEEPEIPARVQ